MSRTATRLYVFREWIFVSDCECRILAYLIEIASYLLELLSPRLFRHRHLSGAGNRALRRVGPANLLQSVPFATAHDVDHLAGDRRAGAADRARASPCAPDVAARDIGMVVGAAGRRDVGRIVTALDCVQLSPDVFTGVLVLVLALLIFVPDRLSARERVWLVAFAAFMIAAHLSHVLLALLLLAVLPPFRPGCSTVMRSITPLALAAIALMSVNLLAFDRASLAPFGNMFLLTRVIYDGPGMDALRHDCPASGWRLCAFIDRMPAIEDDFLWRHDGPVVQAGGAKLLSGEANAIIGAALRAEPSSELLAFGRKSMRQLADFATGDGLQPWPGTVTPVIERFSTLRNVDVHNIASDRRRTHCARLDAETAHCDSAGRRRGMLCNAADIAPSSIQRLRCGGPAGTAGQRGHHRRSLRTHDRYQSRIMWLPPLIAVVCLASLRRPVLAPAFSR